VRGVRDGREANFQDLAEQWPATKPATMAHCWMKASISSPEMEALLNA